MRIIITATEFKTNLGKHLDLAGKQDILITMNGKLIARLTSPGMNKLAALDRLVGIIPKTTNEDEEAIRTERLARQ